MRAFNPKERKRFGERTVIIGDRQAVENLPEAMSAPATGPIHTSWSRLDHLYRIGKLFAEFESIEKPLEAALAIVANTLPLRCAIVIDEVGNRADVRMWASKNVSQQELGYAKAHAAALYSYFRGRPGHLQRTPAWRSRSLSRHSNAGLA